MTRKARGREGKDGDEGEEGPTSDAAQAQVGVQPPLDDGKEQLLLRPGVSGHAAIEPPH